MASIMAPSIMAGLPHDIIRQIILESTREERLRKDTLDYWTRLWAVGHRAAAAQRLLRVDGADVADEMHRVQYKALKEVHNQMKQVTCLERHAQRIHLCGPQIDEETGSMWRRVWWARKSSPSFCYPGTRFGDGRLHGLGRVVHEWWSLLEDLAQKDKEEKELLAWPLTDIHYDPTREFILAQHD
jgi:hypothetical protein